VANFGFHRTRHYGLLSNGARCASLALARKPRDAPAPPASSLDDGSAANTPPCFICRHCGRPLLDYLRRSTRDSRSAIAARRMNRIASHRSLSASMPR
jgi:hypothetical protein